jgi:hypothetical protein
MSGIKTYADNLIINFEAKEIAVLYRYVTVGGSLSINWAPRC